jgi:5'-nucleotidase
MISGSPPETTASQPQMSLKKPCILLTNDDGVNSEGLWAAYDALRDLADVVVCAPATQQSAVGRSLSIFEPLRVNTVNRER